jgi:hypothetical protein
MKKAVPAIVIVLLALVAAWLIAKLSGDAPPPPANNGEFSGNIDFKAEDFIPTFDLDADGKVTLDEFKQRYGKPLAEGQPPLIFHTQAGGPELSAEDAFHKYWDRDSNGVVDAADMRAAADNRWVAFRDDANRKGLKAVDFEGRYLALNTAQNGTFEAESGASTRKELPYAGRFWAARYFGSWVQVTEADGDVQGFGSYSNGKLYLLTPDAKLSVKDPAKVQVSELGDEAPQMQYARELAKFRFDDVQANLQLARKCRQWGMLTEAGMLYARVLVFEPANQEALDALDLTVKDGQFVKKGE